MDMPAVLLLMSVPLFQRRHAQVESTYFKKSGK